MSLIRPATKPVVPMMLMVAGGSGAGKTDTSLRIAHHLGGAEHGILLIDTELLGGESRAAFDYGQHYRFDVLPITPAYARPDQLLSLLQAELPAWIQAHPGGWVIFDSLTTIHHAKKAWATENIAEVGDQFGRHSAEPNRAHRAFFSFLTKLRTNLICTCRAELSYALKEKAAEKERRLLYPRLDDLAFDTETKEVPYAFSLILHMVVTKGGKHHAFVVKAAGRDNPLVGQHTLNPDREFAEQLRTAYYAGTTPPTLTATTMTPMQKLQVLAGYPDKDLLRDRIQSLLTSTASLIPDDDATLKAAERLQQRMQALPGLMTALEAAPLETMTDTDWSLFLLACHDGQPDPLADPAEEKAYD